MNRIDASGPSDDLANTLRRLVDRVSHSGGAALGRMEEAGVTLAQVVLMNRIAALGRVSISDLAPHAPSTVAAVGQMIDRLVRKGLVERVEDPADRRRKAVSVSKAGARLIGALEQARTADYAAGLAAVTPELGARLCGLMRQAIGEIEEARADVEDAS